ncbi:MULTISPECIES: phosphate ABC transporter permease subunit PstC [Breznakia]|uniref:Phosphate transport system permease protein n=1 Tax=Breznakia blatticola TaxID=1754012 RepID=A0A4R7ZUY6_9FIRM|nr:MULTISPECIES: phosphate ABC transporter permease subunit PstC [Breznakia]MDH6366876.1 phosphate transport system permease protein [Breznakia sp. PH1-1]MDH6404054.1 phosphate transport system permease protein [Breznakia sp. PF1-11]MDH6411724.1 phosphate transport system permease protein [Breznakia sp. PFB1-11]MDH6414042.1 phosphate transport system permease protein [Breznakia sp. PFB1-14]MDH6416472.1 phosphate transport system permease protein [Breznakia sp. PFB1-4]
MKRMHSKLRIDAIFKTVVFFFTCISVIALAAILIFTLLKALPLFKEVNIIEFITSDVWSPSTEQFGIASFVVASILTTILACLIGIPVGLYTAIFISEIAPKKIASFVLFAVEILASIPSVIYGFFGLTVMVPFVQKLFNIRSGTTLFTASLILALMILPTVVSLSTSALKAVPKTIDEGSLALGATKMQTIMKTKIPYAKSGILTSFLLGLGRALGETMAVMLVAGNANMMPQLIPISEAYLNGGRTLTGNIIMELAYASGTHEAALFATGVVLFIFVCLINIIILRVKRKGVAHS